MHLSDAEKLILMMLCDIHEKLGIENSVEPAFIRRAIDTENEWGIRWKYQGIPFEERTQPPVVQEVLDILEMWRMVESGYEALSDAERKRVDEELDRPGAPRFEGFDGNYESDHLNVAAFLIDDLDRYSEFSGRGLNTHFPILGAYQRMLSSYLPLRGGLEAGQLSADQIIEILQERVHPDHR